VTAKGYGVTGTYHFVDNLARAVRHVTRQLVDLIPKIYDTQRVAASLARMASQAW
jgi:hypothetical protein